MIGSKRLTSHSVGVRRCILNKSLLRIFHAILSVMRTTTNFTRRSDFVHLDRLVRSKMSFHQMLDLIFKLDEASSDVVTSVIGINPNLLLIIRYLFLPILLLFAWFDVEIWFLGSRRGGGKKQKSNVNVTIGSSLDSGFSSLSEVANTLRTQDRGLYEGNTVTDGSTGQVSEVTVVLSGTSNGVGHEFVIKKIPASYANKLIPTSLTKANLWKLDANVLNDFDYDVWLPLTSVHEVNDRMKNSQYGYFICKRLAFPVMECHLLDDCPKAPKRVVNMMDKGNGGSSGVDDDGFVEVKKKKSCGNNVSPPLTQQT
ncbi:hypothetical protein Tco_1017494 [Tanacetum coccineum]|uniref:Uncharacterized protein n=1 Tax=Tanacetum coccineum TaxID=301880 RepID=A0ABQ5FS29_9ASTR